MEVVINCPEDILALAMALPADQFGPPKQPVNDTMNMATKLCEAGKRDKEVLVTINFDVASLDIIEKLIVAVLSAQALWTTSTADEESHAK